MQDTFNYGYTFQIKLITSLIKSPLFLKQIDDIIHESNFDSYSLKYLVKFIKSYYSKYKTSPTLDVIAINLKSLDDKELFEESKINLRDIYKNLDASDLDFIQEKTLEFCKNQALKNAIEQSIDLLKANKYDNIKNIISEALMAGQETNIGHDYKTQLEERYTDIHRNPIPTGWSVINDLMQGGLGNGELGIILGSTGNGKSWLLSAIGMAALLSDKTVVHYTLELDECTTGKRYDSLLTGINFNDLKYNKDVIEEKLNALKKNLIIKEYPMKRATIGTLESHLEKLKTLNIDPDLVLIDYGDLLKHTTANNREEHAILADLYANLRGLAQERKIPIWTPSQVNRSGFKDKIVEIDSVAASFDKLFVADFIISISRTLDDKIAGTGRIYIAKNRFGPDGIVLPTKIDLNKGLFEIFDPDSDSGRQISKDSEENNVKVKEYLNKQYKDFSKEQND